MTSSDVPATSPAPWVKRVVSAIVVLHFFAILTTLVGSGNIRFPPPTLAALARHWRPIDAYLQATFLTSPFRFFAPDPGPTNLLWFELTYEDGTARWAEVADKEEVSNAIAFQRDMSLALLLGWMGLVPDGGDSRKSTISEEGQVCASSFVRRVARMNRRVDARGVTVPIRSITELIVYHQVLQPFQIRSNWQPDDLRLYSHTYLGVYSPEGVRQDDENKAGAYEVPSDPYLLAEFLLQFGGAAFGDAPADKRLGRLSALHLPAPWQRLLSRHPELLDDVLPRPDDAATDAHAALERLQKHIESAVASNDAAGTPATAPSTSIAR